MKKYQIIYADPPWEYRTWTAKGGHKSASAHYDTMKLKDICNLPIQEISNDNCVLFMWATFPNLYEAFEVIKAWGFEYKTISFVWVKAYDNRTPVMGLGYWTRANAEICMLATRGKIKRVNSGVEQVVISKLGKHSEKPHEVRNRIVKLMGNLLRIELFARGEKDSDLFGFNKFKGWDVWGNEVESDIDLLKGEDNG